MPVLIEIGRMARFFMSRDARFTSVDPSPGNLQNPQSQNRYNYTLNNPLKFVDPSGKLMMGHKAAQAAAIREAGGGEVFMGGPGPNVTERLEADLGHDINGDFVTGGNITMEQGMGSVSEMSREEMAARNAAYKEEKAKREAEQKGKGKGEEVPLTADKQRILDAFESAGQIANKMLPSSRQISVTAFTGTKEAWKEMTGYDVTEAVVTSTSDGNGIQIKLYVDGLVAQQSASGMSPLGYAINATSHEIVHQISDITHPRGKTTPEFKAETQIWADRIWNVWKQGR